MYMQPIYRMNEFITREGNGRAKTNAYISEDTTGFDEKIPDVGMNIFHKGLYLPSDNKMTLEHQDRIINVIRTCFE